MPTNQINTSFDAGVHATNKSLLDTLHANFTFAINLSKDERTSVHNIQNERYPYAQRAVEIHAVNNPNLVLGFAGSTADAQKDWELVKQCDEVIPKILGLLEKYVDTRQLAASEVLAFMRNLYAAAQLAAANNVPGANAVVDDLKTLFENQGGQGQP